MVRAFRVGDEFQLIDAIFSVIIHAAVHIADRAGREHAADTVDPDAPEKFLALGGDDQRVGEEHHLRREVLRLGPAVDAVVEHSADAGVRDGIAVEIDMGNAFKIRGQAGDDRRLPQFFL